MFFKIIAVISGISVFFKMPQRFLCTRLAFPDYLLVSYHYGESNKKFGRVTKDLEIMQSNHKLNMTIGVIPASN